MTPEPDPRHEDPDTQPIPHPRADEARTELLPALRRQRDRSTRAVRMAWTVFLLVVLAFYAVPTVAALGWW